MNPLRLRPDGVARENLDLWLAGVVNDAIRDAVEAGLSTTAVVHTLRSLDTMWGGHYVIDPAKKEGP